MVVVLEIVCGGLLRRGLAVPYATAAIVTNISEDHFGGYGIRSLADLGIVKLCVADALTSSGTLVLNGDDETLRALAFDDGTTRPSGAGAYRDAGDHAGHVDTVEWFSAAKIPDWMPLVSEMPITLGGAAAFNVMNAIGAALVARALGVGTEVIGRTLREFGRDAADNPGRLERYEVGGVRVWVDYAHNPQGLAALLSAARNEPGIARMGLLLGQAGDRDDDAIRDLARTAWAAHPDRVVIKEMHDYLRGRFVGDVPVVLRRALTEAGAPPDALADAPDEVAGVRALLQWARRGDLLVLPVHSLDARGQTNALLNELRDSGWLAPD